jgi:Rad3-related DNA helicase
LARRVELDRTYYTWITSLKLCQSYGRSIRSESDFADTYIIDGAFTKFRQMAKNILPEWFTEAIIEEK